MKKILRKYPEAILLTAAALFLVAIFFAYSWGIGTAVREVNRGANAKGDLSGAPGFDLHSAAALDWRGLVKTQ